MAAAPTTTGVSNLPWADPAEFGWAVYDRLTAVFAAPLEPLFAAVERADSLDVLLGLTDPDAFRHGCARGLAAVEAERTDPTWPPGLRSALAELGREARALLTRFEPTAQLVRSAADRVRQLRIPSGSWGAFFRGAGEGASGTTAAGLTALGGAALGTLLLPGIGTVVGLTVGGYLGGRQTDQRNAAAVEEFDRAFAQVGPAIRDIFAAAWDDLAGRMERAAGLTLPTWSTLTAAEEAWEALRTEFTRTESWYGKVKGYVARHGPHPQALRGLVLVGVTDSVGRTSEAGEWVDRLRRLYPGRIEVAECEALLLRARGCYPEAAAAAIRGLERVPDHAVLREVRAEALAAAGRGGEVDPGRWIGSDGDVWLAYTRGECRAGAIDDAAVAVRHWQAAGADLLTVVRCLQADAVTRPCLVPMADRISEFRPFVAGGLEEVRAIARMCLPADGQSTFHDLPPLQRGDAVRKHILRDRPGYVLYVEDWSFWSDGKIGLVLLDSGVVWRTTWSEPVGVVFKGLSEEAVSVAGGVLTLGPASVNIGDASRAAALGRAIREIVQVTNRR